MEKTGVIIHSAYTSERKRDKELKKLQNNELSCTYWGGWNAEDIKITKQQERRIKMTLSKIINEYHHEKFRFNQEFSDRVVESISPKLELLEYTVLSSIARDPTEILVRSETGKVHIHLSTRGNSVYCRDSRNLGMTKEQIAEIKRVITGGIL